MFSSHGSSSTTFARYTRHIGAYPPNFIERAFAAVERITPRVRSAMEAARAQGADERSAEEAGFQACAAALHEEATLGHQQERLQILGH